MAGAAPVQLADLRPEAWRLVTLRRRPTSLGVAMLYVEHADGPQVRVALTPTELRDLASWALAAMDSNPVRPA